jgi:hypothetical protein
MPYDKMQEYITSLCDVAQMVNNKGREKRDRRQLAISLMISNYVIQTAKAHNINLMQIHNNPCVNLIPIFEYVAANNVELYDFKTINMNDLDVTKKEDLERFVLTHVYYITQGK